MAEWKGLATIVQTVKTSVEVLQGENRNVQVQCKRYTKLLGKELATPKECEDIRQINEQLQKIKEDLNKVLEKASDKVVIEFVGATSSGKSTLINALLREERLPVGVAETTMCLTEICTSKDDHWKVEVDGKPLSSGRNKEEVKDLLNAIICDNLRKEREDMGINEDSRVIVYWPAKFSPEVLPENVVLLDSPGFGEDEGKADKIVIDSCKKADIIVAVMDVMSPSKSQVTKLVKEVDCQYTFGVFTKWDEFVEKQEKRNSPNISSQYLRDKNETKFLNSVNSGTKRCTKDDIFFVDSQYVLKYPEIPNIEAEQSFDGAREFQQFEKRLAESAKEKKGELLKTQVKSVVEKFKHVIEKFKSSVEERKKLKLVRLEKTRATLRARGKEFSGICDVEKHLILTELDARFTEVETKLIREFETDVQNGNLSEEDALEKIRHSVNEKLKETVKGGMANANEKFKNWYDCMNSVFPFKESEMLITESEIAHLKSEKLPEDKYNPLTDPHSYYTNNYVWAGGLFVCVLTTMTGFGVVVGMAETVAATVIEGGVLGGVAGTVTGGAAGGGAWYLKFGDMIKSYQPISAKKLQCLKEFLLDKCKEAHEVSKKVIEDEIDRISKETGDDVKRAKGKMAKEIIDLIDSSHVLNKLWKALEDSRLKVDEI